MTDEPESFWEQVLDADEFPAVVALYVAGLFTVGAFWWLL